MMSNLDKIKYLVDLAEDALEEYNLIHKQGGEVIYPQWAEYIVDIFVGKL